MPSIDEEFTEAFVRDLKLLGSLSEDEYKTVLSLLSHIYDTEGDVVLLSNRLANETKMDPRKIISVLNVVIFVYLKLLKRQSKDQFYDALPRLVTDVDTNKIKSIFEFGLKNYGDHVRMMAVASKELEAGMPRLSSLTISLDYRVSSETADSAPDMLVPIIIATITSDIKGERKTMTLQTSITTFKEILKDLNLFLEREGNLKVSLQKG